MTVNVFNLMRRRSLLRLVSTVMLTGVLTVFRPAAVTAEEEKPPELGQRTLLGRIFLNANLDVKLKGPQKQHQDINGIISVASETGRWDFITHGHNARVSPDGKRLVFLRSVIPDKPPHGTNDFWTHDLTPQQTEL